MQKVTQAEDLLWEILPSFFYVARHRAACSWNLYVPGGQSVVRVHFICLLHYKPLDLAVRQLS